MNEPARKIKRQAPQIVPATLEDLLAIPEEERRHELIEGTIYPRGAASPPHGHIQRRLSAFVDPFDRSPRDSRPGGWWIVSEVDVHFDAKNTLRPDLSGWRREHLPRLPDTPPVRVIPDWTCEILSTNRAHDLVKKKRVYHRYQVKHYWVIDPVAQSLQVLRWTPDGYLEIQTGVLGETLNAEPFEILPFSLAVIFGEDEDDDDAQDDSPDEKAEKAD